MGVDHANSSTPFILVETLSTLKDQKGAGFAVRFVIHPFGGLKQLQGVDESRAVACMPVGTLVTFAVEVALLGKRANARLVQLP